MAVAVGTRAAAELKIVVMLVITAEAQKVVRERQTGRAAKARTILGSGRDVGCVQHQDHMVRAVRWTRRSGKCMSHGDEQRARAATNWPEDDPLDDKRAKLCDG